MNAVRQGRSRRRIAVYIFRAAERAVCTHRATFAASIMNANCVDAPEEERCGAS
jgi:hypothetical protein